MPNTAATIHLDPHANADVRPDVPRDELAPWLEPLNALAAEIGPIPGGDDGYYRPSTETIVVEAHSPNRRVKTLVPWRKGRTPTFGAFRHLMRHEGRRRYGERAANRRFARAWCAHMSGVRTRFSRAATADARLRAGAV